ncbi:hypothetical protein H0W91_01860 [Patescibacteria group bacterium]|nr:hypothetical protein [Patescibacteria group bacterium]
MSKKPLIITVSVTLALLVIVLISYYFLLQNKNSDPNSPVSIFKSFLPFGGGTASPQATSTINKQPTTETPVVEYTQKLRKLSTEPVAGAGVVDFKAGTVVRYIEKATGHIFETELFSPLSHRISNTTIPVVYDALWGNGNSSLVVRYLKDDDVTVDTYALTIKDLSTTTESLVSAVTLPLNIKDVSVFGNNVFYLITGETSSLGFVSSMSGQNRKQIWSSPIKELLSQFVNVKTVALTTKPAQSIPGFLYLVDTGSGGVKRILGNISGLSTLVNGTATSVLYLEQGEGLSMSVFDVKTASVSLITPTTFPEKCIWSKKDTAIVYCAVPRGNLSGSSLTSWYMGYSSYTDDIWKYDTKNNTSSIVDTLYEDSSESIDVIKPILSDNEQYLVFMNKRDNSLWSLDLTK